MWKIKIFLAFGKKYIWVEQFLQIKNLFAYVIQIIFFNS